VGTADPTYILTDHLGSTTVTTDASGNLVSELRYLPWGEVRAGPAGTDYTFTGQYSNVGDFGLMYYNARWYDVGLGRFASADSIVPNAWDSQSWDRYSYVQNRPIVFADPSGHRAACGSQGEACDEGPLPQEYGRKLKRSHQIEEMFPGVTITNPYAFTVTELDRLSQALTAVFAAFGNNRGAFEKAFGPMSFTLKRFGSLGQGVPARADMWVSGDVRLTPRASYENMIHEMGHIFDGRLLRRGQTTTLFSEYWADHLNAGSCRRSPCYTEKGFSYELQHGDWDPSGLHSDYANTSSLEDFADSFEATITGGSGIDDERKAIVGILIALQVQP
jgi:RHS repeat-associated protein